MAAKKGRAKKTKKKRQPLRVDEAAFKQAHKLLMQAIEQAGGENSFERQHHRQPALTDAEWRENVNKQLDALGAWQHVSGRQHYLTELQTLGTGAILERLVTTTEALTDIARGYVEILKETNAEVLRLAEQTHHPVKAARAWRFNADKLAKHLKNLDTLMIIFARFSTLFSLASGQHVPPQLPPSE